jgi:hypothetical protein
MVAGARNKRSSPKKSKRASNLAATGKSQHLHALLKRKENIGESEGHGHEMRRSIGQVELPDDPCPSHAGERARRSVYQPAQYATICRLISGVPGSSPGAFKIQPFETHASKLASPRPRSRPFSKMVVGVFQFPWQVLSLRRFQHGQGGPSSMRRGRRQPRGTQ